MQEPSVYTGHVLSLVFAIRDQSKKIIDLQTATSMRVDFHRVNGARKTATLVFSTDGTDGKLTYTTSATDLDIPGVWKAQAFYTIGSIEYPVDVVTFNVLPRG